VFTLANHPIDNLLTWKSSKARSIFLKHYEILNRGGLFPSSLNLMFKELIEAITIELEERGTNENPT
jgi:hypothetical protein